MQKLVSRSVYSLLFLVLIIIGVLVFQDIRYNFHTVIPNKVYRSAELSSSKLISVMKKYHIRSIINLRNSHPNEKWYQLEQQDAKKFHATLYDLSVQAHKTPNKQQLQTLIHTLKNVPLPMLIHCKNGADRTGLASSLALIILNNSTYQNAYQQVSFKYLALSPNSVGRLVLPKYHAWLQAHRLKSSRHNLLAWANSNHPLK